MAKTQVLVDDEVGGGIEAPVFEARFRVMGTDAHLTSVGGSRALLDEGEKLVRQLESLWSRFLPDSEISVLNRNTGRAIIVSKETFGLIERAIQAWAMTGGCFNPCVATALAANGYDRDFRELSSLPLRPLLGVPVPSPQEIVMLKGTNTIIMPPGLSIDPGGIGKGLAADWVTNFLVTNGALGAMVNLGGDLRVMGQAPSSDGWVISIPDPQVEGDELVRFKLEDGAVATSSRLKRRWQSSDGEAHHLVDPATGRPMVSDVVVATAIAATGWQAEAFTKSLFMKGPKAFHELPNVHAIVVLANGTRMASPGAWEVLR